MSSTSEFDLLNPYDGHSSALGTIGVAMNFIEVAPWSLDVATRGFWPPRVLDHLASTLRRGHDDFERRPLPDRLQALVARFEEAETESMYADEDDSLTLQHR